MQRCLKPALCALVSLAAAVKVAGAAVPAGETLYPGSTKGFLSVANVELLDESWRRTQLGQLMQDPVMQPFEEDFKAQLKKKWGPTQQRLGLSLDDLEGVPTGQVTVAAIEPPKGEHAVAITMDVTGHEQQGAALLEKVAKSMQAQQARRSQHEAHGIKITLFDVPKREDKPARQVAYFLHGGVLAGADNLQVLEGMANRFGHESKDSLASAEAFAAIVQRCRNEAGDMAPQITWFIEPFGYADVMRAANPERHRRKGPDLLKLLRHQGFTAIQGVGGFVNLAVDKYEWLHRTAVYAPPVPGAAKGEKYELAARMLDFPNGGSFEPLPWLPRDVAMFASFNLEVKKAFEASKTLINEYVGDEVFEDVLDGLKNDPDGPHIDVRKDLVALLDNRVSVISDYKLPITTKSERIMVAIATTDEPKLAATIAKAMKADPQTRRREVGGHVIWEVIEEEAQAPMVTIENQPAFGPVIKGEDAKEEEEKEAKLMPNSAVTVANGHLLWATNVDFLVKVLSSTDAEKLKSSADFDIVDADLAHYKAPESSALAFSRTDEEYRAVYELVRQGRMPEAETVFARLLNNVLSGGSKQGTPRKQKIDGSHLPDFETVRRYFGPAGLTVHTEEKGWFITGFTLNKQP